jgi:hypothetical protein
VTGAEILHWQNFGYGKDRERGCNLDPNGLDCPQVGVSNKRAMDGRMKEQMKSPLFGDSMMRLHKAVSIEYTGLCHVDAEASVVG